MVVSQKTDVWNSSNLAPDCHYVIRLYFIFAVARMVGFFAYLVTTSVRGFSKIPLDRLCVTFMFSNAIFDVGLVPVGRANSREGYRKVD